MCVGRFITVYDNGGNKIAYERGNLCKFVNVPYLFGTIFLWIQKIFNTSNAYGMIINKLESFLRKYSFVICNGFEIPTHNNNLNISLWISSQQSNARTNTYEKDKTIKNVYDLILNLSLNQSNYKLFVFPYVWLKFEPFRYVENTQACVKKH